MTTTHHSPDVRVPWVLVDTGVLTARAIRHAFRQVDGLLLGVILPVMLLLLFVYVFGGAIAVDGPYLDYVVPGIVLLTAGFGASQTAIAVAGDLGDGMIDRFRSLPMADVTLLGSHVLAALLRNLFSTALVIGLAIAIGFRPTTDPLAWLGAIAVIALFVVAMAWVSVAAGVAARSADAASGFTFFVLFLPYLSSAFVPPESLPTALRGFAEHQPVTPVIETVRGLLLETPVGSAWATAVAWCAGIAVLAAVASWVVFRRRMSA